MNTWALSSVVPGALSFIPLETVMCLSVFHMFRDVNVGHSSPVLRGPTLASCYHLVPSSLQFWRKGCSFRWASVHERLRLTNNPVGKLVGTSVRVGQRGILSGSGALIQIFLKLTWICVCVFVCVWDPKGIIKFYHIRQTWCVYMFWCLCTHPEAVLFQILWEKTQVKFNSWAIYSALAL